MWADVCGGPGNPVGNEATTVINQNKSPPAGAYKGVAYMARLAFMDICLTGQSMFTMPTNIGEIFQAAKDVGAFVHSDSWGTPGNEYHQESVDLDK